MPSVKLVEADIKLNSFGLFVQQFHHGLSHGFPDVHVGFRIAVVVAVSLQMVSGCQEPVYYNGHGSIQHL
jgi:hypothetical protein